MVAQPNIQRVQGVRRVTPILANDHVGVPVASLGERAPLLRSQLPHAEQRINGEPWLFFRHSLRAARLLVKAGMPIPPPILMKGDEPFKGKFTPYQHQRVTSAFLTLYERAYVLSTMGTGKTLAAIWAAEFLRATGEAKRVLVVAPLSTLKDVWRRELLQADPALKVAVLHGRKSERQRLLNEDFDWFIINHDGVKLLRDDLVARKEITHIIIDEASQFKNPSTQRWKAMNAVAKDRTLWAMTGTPMAQSPEDAYGLIKLVNPSVFTHPVSRTRWKAMTMFQVNQFLWKPKREANDIVYKHLQPSIRYTLDECVDLPGVVYENRTAPLSKAQEALTRKLIKDWVVTTKKGETIKAVNAAARMAKLLQIAQGAVLLEDDSVTAVDAKPRLKVLKECINESPAKVLVFAPFKAVLRMIEDDLNASGIGAVRVDGSVSETKRAARFERFRTDPDIRVLVAHPKVAAHGLTLTEAATIVWYGPEHSVESYEQANARTNRPGQTLRTTIIHLTATEVERKIFQAVRGKADMQKELLYLYEGLVGAARNGG